MLFFACLIVAAVFSARISSRLGVPVLLSFIGLGILVGSDVLNLFYFDDAVLTKRIADIILIFILFVGGFQTRKSSLRLVAGPSMLLATVGVALTAGLLGLLVHLVTGLSPVRSFMIASIISSTDAAAVMMVTRANPVRERVAATLEVESAANDPAAILLTIAFVELAAGKGGDPVRIALEMAWQLVGGVAFGFLASRASRFLFDRLESDNRGYYYVLAIGMILLAYGAADLAGANGIIAVFFMGYLLGNAEFAGKQGVSNFLEGVSAFGNVALFLMLGLLASPRGFVHVWKEGLLLAALLVFGVRPLVAFLGTAGFRYGWRERLFIAWGGIKGAVPIVLATYPAAFGLDPEGTVFSLIFFAVLVSCLVQGTTLAPLARLLGLVVPARPRSPHSVELHSTRRSEIGLFEIHIEPGARATGRSIRDLGLPHDIVISSIVRDGRIILPKGGSVVETDDLLYALGPPSLVEATSAVLNAKDGPPDREA